MEDRTQLELYHSKTTSPLAALWSLIGGAILLVGLVAGLIASWQTFVAGANTVVRILIYLAVAVIPAIVVGAIVLATRAAHRREKLAALEVERKTLEVERQRREIEVLEENTRRQEEAHAVEMDIRRRTINFDEQANAALYDARTGRIIQLRGQMREFPQITAYHHHQTTTGTGTKVTEEKPELPRKKLLGDLHIPSFLESFQSGLIGPGQRDILICYELKRDEDTGVLTGEIVPYTDRLENNCTMFLGGGSKSGKSTLMAHLAAQEAMMNALFYVIDPHLTHPERAVSVKLRALAHAFILPPAMTDTDIYVVLEHAKAEAEARRLGQETPYSGHPIVFIVDEILNLFGRAQRQPDNRQIQQLYQDLALFMRDLGTQYNKYEVNGIFATQYVTKDAFKLPSGSVDFRDGCQNQTLLRLPPNQAQAMRLLQRDELRTMRELPPGHGYMGFSSGDIIRMAFGNVTAQDITTIGHMVAPAPRSRLFAPGTLAVPHSTPTTSPVPPRTAGTENPTAEQPLAQRLPVVTGPLRTGGAPPENTAEPGTARVQRVKPKQFTPEQELEFVKLFSRNQNIKTCLAAMRLGVGTYHRSASDLVERKKLRKE